MSPIFEKTSTEIYELARRYFELQDYSGSIALCTYSLSIFDNNEDCDIQKSLILLAVNLYHCKLERKVYLRPLTISLLENNKFKFSRMLREFNRDAKQLGLVDVSVIVLIILKLILLESWGLYLKSGSNLFKRFRLLIDNFVTSVFRSE